MENSTSKQNIGLPLTRREFLKTSTAATAGLMASSNFAFGFAASETIRIGLIGCGGRGTGAAKDCVESSPGVEIVALGDLFEDRVNQCKEQLRVAIGDRFKVTDDHCFAGFGAYKNVIASEVDLILLATPPGFRPMHLRAAIEAGKHVFMEKPVAVDPVGVRSVMESSDMATQKGLAIVAGTQRRHHRGYVEALKRIHGGAIGDIVAAQVYWNQGGLWMRPRQPGWTDMEWQARNWLYFTWLSGDHIVEQHIHNIDVANWALQSHPVKAVGVGGRQVRVDPAYGHIFDHFAIEFEYPNGARVSSMCRQIDGTASQVSEHIVGTKGTSNASSWIRGAKPWRMETDAPNPYVEEHRDLIASIRKAQPLNEGRQVAESTLTAIMGREAAYTGQAITWDEILNAELDLTPKSFSFGPLPVPPVAVPGATKLSRTT
ncbi:Gfo/Idh/MocA family oxidoreductase [candidate division KSB1 bacterium]|nr:Gfo/Idh/MocA family oxidoreductase [candidate division KSB1 bacterium]